MEILLEVKEELFRFSDFDDWVNNAPERYVNGGIPPKYTVALDTGGRTCLSGKEFMTARDEGTFPVIVYSLKDF